MSEPPADLIFRSLDSGHDGDSAWPLWGLATRLASAMGLHRDGVQWGLADDQAEERRHVLRRFISHTQTYFLGNLYDRRSHVKLLFETVRTV